MEDFELDILVAHVGRAAAVDLECDAAAAGELFVGVVADQLAVDPDAHRPVRAHDGPRSPGLADLGDGYQDFKEVVDRFSAGQELDKEEKFKLDFLTDALRNAVVTGAGILFVIAMTGMAISRAPIIAASKEDLPSSV